MAGNCSEDAQTSKSRVDIFFDEIENSAMPLTKIKRFMGVKFTSEVIRQGLLVFNRDGAKTRFNDLSVGENDEAWEFEEEAEFYSAYRSETIVMASLICRSDNDRKIVLKFDDIRGTTLHVSHDSRADIERCFATFEENAEACRLSADISERALRERLRIFIGHGRNAVWRDLKDHLHEKHGFKVTAYETKARVGLHISDVLANMKQESSFAILVMTGENEDATGMMHARENVIHEIGLFQGKLGFKRAIILLEDGCAEFSNVAGVQHLPFPPGGIRETFGDVLAAIRREFVPD